MPRCLEARQPRSVGAALRSVPLVELSGPRIDSNGNSIGTAARTFVLSQGAKRYRIRTRSETWNAVRANGRKPASKILAHLITALNLGCVRCVGQADCPAR